MSSADAAPVPEGAKCKLAVIRGMRVGKTYGINPGQTFLGRTGEEPVDVNMDEQERPGQVFAANRHACIYFENHSLAIEDLGTSFGTFVNRVKLPPNQRHPLKADDIIQIGSVQLKVQVKAKQRTGVQK
ncbi:MAG: FHA domain-containing protein [Gemmataceae bacterium]|nr:FHA domain-containing protein [Gemmataceae bacterium]MDW8266935.1 FHA domain-containing protein [Gemmataceae bacterium]